jgi:hypothetical protein
MLEVVMDHLRRFQRSVFRLEALDEYTSDAEREEMTRWFRGERIDPGARDNEYLRLIRAAAAAGKPWRRVHTVTGPTPYLRFEIEYYGHNEAAGEEIAILQAPEPTAVFGERPTDFWLFDDEVVLDMRYDATGRIAAVPVLTDHESVGRCRRLRDRALEQAVPLREYRAALRQQVIPAPALPVEAAHRSP